MSATTKSVELLIPQVRVLKALASVNGDGLLSRAKLATRCGWSPISGTVNRALHGVAKNSKQAASEVCTPHKGLLALKLVEYVDVQLDGDKTDHGYRLLPAGKKALAAWLKDNKLPKMRSKEASVNKRYA